MRAATVISLMILVKTLPRLASIAPFLRRIVAHLEWPDTRIPSFRTQRPPDLADPGTRALTSADYCRSGLFGERFVVGATGSTGLDVERALLRSPCRGTRGTSAAPPSA